MVKQNVLHADNALVTTANEKKQDKTRASLSVI